MSSGDCVLTAHGIGCRFPGVQALQDVSLCLRAGEVHALLGQNGAGKSTLIRVLTGAQRATAGWLALDGAAVQLNSPLQAQHAGISTVHQEINLCPNLSVAENLLAGRYPRRPWWQGGGIHWRRVRQQAEQALGRLHLDIDVLAQLDSYPVAIQQMVAIARAMSVRARVLILDEPTASLDAAEVMELFRVLRQLRAQGIAILLVTHFLDQVYAIADRMTVLRNGRLVGEYRTDLEREALIVAMVGHELEAARQNARTAAHVISDGVSQPLLQVRGVAHAGQSPVLNVQIRAGEVLGIAGLLGSGRTTLARSLFGLSAPQSRVIHIDGRAVSLTGPSTAIQLGLGYCPEERKTEGIVAELSVRDNVLLALQARHGLRSAMRPSEQRLLTQQFITKLGIKTPSTETPAGLLSGGNQQKVLLARWLALEPRLLILDEPTRGVDIAAKQEILQELRRLARSGVAVVFISADIDEVVRIADRILVMRDRQQLAELPGDSDVSTVLQLIARAA